MENSVKELTLDIKEMKQSLMQFQFHIRMDTADIHQYFPLDSDDDLQRFMNEDEDWNQRRKESFFNI